MATLTIKNIPDALVRRLKAKAAANRRSLNQEVIGQLEAGNTPTPVDVEALIAEARALRTRMKGVHVTNAMIDRWKRQGRP